MILVPPSKNERQQSVDDFISCILSNSRAVQWHTPIIIILAAFIGKNASDNTATTFKKMSINGASTIFGIASWIIRQQSNSIDP